MLATIDQVSDQSFDYIIVGRSSCFPLFHDHVSFDKSLNTSGGGVQTQLWCSMDMRSHTVTDYGPRCRHALVRRSFGVHSGPGGGWPQSGRSRNQYDIMFHFTHSLILCAQ